MVCDAQTAAFLTIEGDELGSIVILTFVHPCRRSIAEVRLLTDQVRSTSSKAYARLLL